MKILLGLALLPLLSACAGNSAPPPYFDTEYSGAPLQARIVNVSGDLQVYTSRAAHVAIFEIVPGHGVGLLYPAFEREDRYLPGGMQRLWLSATRPYYGYFQASHRSNVPRYLYMVASDAPLRLSRYVNSPSALRHAMGVRNFVAHNPFSVMNDLERLVAPDVPDAAWDSDVLVIWPENRYRDGLRDFDWVRIRCADGRVVEGPTYLVLGACNRLAPPPLAQRPPPQEEEGDSIRTPIRRRPEPGGAGAHTGDPVRSLPIDEVEIPVVERAEPPEQIRQRGFGGGSDEESRGRLPARREPRTGSPTPQPERTPERAAPDVEARKPAPPRAEQPVPRPRVQPPAGEVISR